MSIPEEINLSFCFNREEHLKGRNDIRKVFKKGRQIGCNGAKLFILKNELSYNRICFTLSKGFCNAPARNRAKRLSREAFRLMKNRIETGHDLILLIYLETKTKLSDRIKQLEILCKRAGILKI